MIYVILVENLLNGQVKVSQEAYSTLEAAQEFCKSRSGNITRLNRYKFKDGHSFIYKITEVSVK